MADFTGLYKMLQIAASYGFKIVVDAFVIVDRLLPSLQTPENVMHGPLAILLLEAHSFPLRPYSDGALCGVCCAQNLRR